MGRYQGLCLRGVRPCSCGEGLVRGTCFQVSESIGTLMKLVDWRPRIFLLGFRSFFTRNTTADACLGGFSNFSQIYLKGVLGMVLFFEDKPL